MSMDLADNKSTLVQVTVWSRQTPNHYPRQCWPWSMSPYGVSRPWWVNNILVDITKMMQMRTQRLVRVHILRPRQHGRHFPDDSFISIFVNENIWISINISLRFASKVPINHIPALIRIMAWRRPGAKPLSEAMMVILPTHICVTGLPRVKALPAAKYSWLEIPPKVW